MELSSVFDNEILPLVYRQADEIFPEFKFRPSNKGWASGNKRRLSGSDGDSKGKVWIYQSAPYFIKEWTTGGEALISYVKHREGLEWLDAVKYLAGRVGYHLGELELTDSQSMAATKAVRNAELLEVVNDYFIESLKTDAAKACRDYLESRGYGELDLGLGYIPSQDALKAHILSKEFSEDEFDEAFSVSASVGKAHKLTIPYRDRVGRVIGFVFRSIDDSTQPKYLYTKELSVGSNLFNLSAIRDSKDLVLVEGMLDALHAEALGVKNVVALGSNKLTSSQLELIKRLGAKTVTLCLDNDEAGRAGTEKAIKDLIENNFSNVYVAPLPTECKDPDELLVRYGADALKLSVNEAQSWYLYRLDRMLARKPTDQLADREKDALVDEVVELGSLIKDVRRRSALVENCVARCQSVGITSETLSSAVERQHENLVKQKQIESVKRELQKASRLADKGDLEGVKCILAGASEQAAADSRIVFLDGLLEPDTEEELVSALKSEPSSTYSGFDLSGKPLMIPSGEITVVAAPTGHGKTTLLNNLALNFASQFSKHSVYYFTFEEAKHALYPKLINTFINRDFSDNNLEFIKNQLKGDCKKGEWFHKKVQSFFDLLIHSGKLKVIYEEIKAQDLISAIYHVRKHGKPGAVFIDYVQLLQVEGGKHNTRQEEMKQICQLLKRCANETRLPIIVAAQFNRDVKSEKDLHYTRIREAGDIEQIAGLSIGVWNKSVPPADADIVGFTKVPEMHVRIMKNRNGESNVWGDLNFNANTGKISNKSTNQVYGDVDLNSIYSTGSKIRPKKIPQNTYSKTREGEYV